MTTTPTVTAPLRILIADDHDVMRDGTRSLIERQPGWEVCGVAGTGREAVAMAIQLRPDIVIMDLRLPDGTGVEACREIRSERPAVHVIMLTSYSDEEAVVSSIVAGAAGYVLKETPPRQLLEALETVARGDSLLDPGVLQAVLNRLRRCAHSSSSTR